MRRHRSIHPVRLLAGALAGLVLFAPVVGASSAEAHDVLVSTSPADGSTVDTVPNEVVLTFDQPAIAVGTEIAVSGPDGDVQQGRPRLVDSTVRQGLAAGSPAGSYTVTWRVTSADCHPVSGTFSFTAMAATGATATPSTPASTSSADPTTATSSPSSTTAPTTTASTPIPSQRTTGGADRTGTSWAVFTVVGLVILAGLVALVVRFRRGNGISGQG